MKKYTIPNAQCAKKVKKKFFKSFFFTVAHFGMLPWKILSNVFFVFFQYILQEYANGQKDTFFWKLDHCSPHSDPKTKIYKFAYFFSKFWPFDFESHSWPQLFLKLGKLFSGILWIDGIKVYRLTFLENMISSMHSEPRKAVEII